MDTYTSLVFQTEVVQRLTCRSTVFMTLDCCHAYRGVSHNRHFLLAASGPDDVGRSGASGFGKALRALLRKALKTQAYLTIGNLHSQMLELVREKKLEVFPFWSSPTGTSVSAPDVLLKPLTKNESVVKKAKTDPVVEMLPAMTLARFAQASSSAAASGMSALSLRPANDAETNKENIALLAKRGPGAYMTLSCRLKEDAITPENAEKLREAFSLMPLGQFENVKIGLGEVVQFGPGSCWVDLKMDVLVWHSLQPHDAIFWTGGPYSMLDFGRSAPAGPARAASPV